MSRDNPFGADNQQERPRLEGWIVGFVDGEGCFSCPIYRSPRMKIRLERIRDFFDCGRIYRNRRRDNHREDMMAYVVPRQD